MTGFSRRRRRSSCVRPLARVRLRFGRRASSRRCWYGDLPPPPFLPHPRHRCFSSSDLVRVPSVPITPVARRCSEFFSFLPSSVLASSSCYLFLTVRTLFFLDATHVVGVGARRRGSHLCGGSPERGLRTDGLLPANRHTCFWPGLIFFLPSSTPSSNLPCPPLSLCCRLSLSPRQLLKAGFWVV